MKILNVFIIALFVIKSTTALTQPPTIITDFHKDSKKVIMDLYDGTIASLKGIFKYATNPEYARNVNINFTIWWEDNMNKDSIESFYNRYSTDPAYARKIEDKIMTQLTYFVVLHRASTIVSDLKIPMTISKFEKFNIAYSGITEMPKVSANLKGFILKLEPGSLEYGIMHIYRNHTPKSMLYKFANNLGLPYHTKTLFLKSSPEYIAKIFAEWTNNSPTLVKTVDGLRIYEGVAETPIGIYRTYRCVVKKSGLVKTFYPLRDINPELLSSTTYEPFIKAQAYKKPSLINFQKQSTCLN